MIYIIITNSGYNKDKPRGFTYDKKAIEDFKKQRGNNYKILKYTNEGIEPKILDIVKNNLDPLETYYGLELFEDEIEYFNYSIDQYFKDFDFAIKDITKLIKYIQFTDEEFKTVKRALKLIIQYFLVVNAFHEGEQEELLDEPMDYGDYLHVDKMIKLVINEFE